MINLLVLAVCGGAAGLLMYPALAWAVLWRATITPLASIIGSGFLVLGPILNHAYGYLAPAVMAGLCAVAYLFGSAIRYNIVHLDSRNVTPRAQPRETVAAWSLAFACIVSVAYYLNLLGSFAVSFADAPDPMLAKTITTLVFAVILGVGWTRGFDALERMEQVSVGLKLAIIAGLLAGLGAYFGGQAAQGALAAAPPQAGALEGVLLAFGLLVTVQGFETSRYLGSAYDAVTRVRSMRLAQGISSLIYMVYIALLCFVYLPDSGALHETAIIAMMGVVASVLPFLLVLAALSAQFSAAVADTNGSGGLLTELTRGRISARAGYGILVACGVVLTWAMSVFEIIGAASRAFAVYYAIQSLIAARTALYNRAPGRAALYAALAVLGAVIAMFGTSVE